VIGFLSIEPFTRGHSLVVPKEHSDDVLDIEDQVFSHVAKVTKRIAHELIQKLGAEGVNLHNNSGEVAGQEVMHFHMHIVPRYEDDGISFGGAQGPFQSHDLDEVLNEIVS
jgi:histidine triad (HIT) family protein